VDRSASVPLRIGAWRVDPAMGQLSRNGETVRLEARTLRLLLYLAGHAGEVVSIDQLLDQVWSGVVVTPDSVYQAVTSLRRLLGDDARQPTYIATVPRLGYRMVATVSPWFDPPALEAEPPRPVAAAAAASAAPRLAARRIGATVAAAAVALVTIVAGAVLWHLIAHHAAVSAVGHRTVAVLPFLDLTTREMTEEYFADGMTEELIDKLSKVSGLKVPGATASFYYKGKKLPLSNIARSLGVAYVVDGSIRKSGPTIRVSVRLVRAEDGYVRWSETYDRPADDRLKIQDEIATAVAKSLRASID
jgi:transcriptional activator of cad operon